MTDQEEQEQRARVIAEAKTWLGIPFRDCGDSKESGIDCGMLLIKIFSDCGIVPWFDPRPYDPRWFINSDEEKFLEHTIKWTVEIPESEAQPGDIVIYKHGRTFSHSALIISNDLILHAYFKEKWVCLCERFQVELNFYGKGQVDRGKPRPRKFFSVWKKLREAD